ncbi:hypothetical protein C8R48DRAFT_670309 [Suillus tomentosus]|nr:hypothetical protein C8R48DRAFT_670309 [Suillus tomentosus]
MWCCYSGYDSTISTHSKDDPLLKIRDLGKTDKRNQAPVLLKSAKVQPSNKPHPVSCFALSSALSFLAIGLADGTVLLYRHPDQSLSSTTSLTTLPNTRIIHESSPESITGLSFREFPSPTNANAKDNNLHLFIVTTNSVYLYHVSGKGSRGSSVLLDDIGCGLGYVVMDWRAEKIVLARDEEVYAYGLQEGSCHMVMKHQWQVEMVMRRGLTYRGVCGGYQRGDLGVGKYLRPHQIMGRLYAKALYPLSPSLAQTQHLGESYVADIHRQHGDHLYTKGDWDGAMTCYLKTIGWVKPSYVVRKSSTPANTPSYLALSRAPAPEDQVEESKADKEDLTEPQTTQPSAPTPSKEKRPSLTLYFACFVDHPPYFVCFLESVAARRPNEDEDLQKHNQAAFWNMLLELYLDRGPPEQQEKALKVLTSHTLPSHSYTRGLVILWEKLGMYEDILRFWMDKHNTSPSESSASTEVVQALVRYGPTHPHLYELVLRFLTSTPELLTRHQADVEKILEHIEKERIIPPLGVVQILSRNGVASVGLVKDWLMGHIKEAREEVQTDQQLISSYRLEANAMLKQVAELEDPMHAKGSLLDHEIECPLCEIRGNHEIKHELFLADVQDNGFKAVAAGFGKGVLNMTRLDDNRYCAVPYFYHMICICYGIQQRSMSPDPSNLKRNP